MDRYLLGELLGSGGMSSVHCAVQLGPLGIARPVAVKELHPHLARDADFTSMLLDEARIQGAVEHPNVVTVVDAIARGGELFLVLSLVHGLPLSALVRRLRERGSSVPSSVAVAIACDMLEGLHAAHELRGADGSRLGVVHRDVSPHNVLVGADGVSRILDFGIATAGARAQVTRGGELKGKPSYMSPEQLDGEKLDHLSDLFSAGLVLVEMLVSRRACPESEPREVRCWMDAELRNAVGWLEGQALEGILVAPIARCLALDARDRPASARAAAAALCAACSRATAAEVATWLEELATDLLDERRAMVDRLRAAAAVHVETSPTRPASPTCSTSPVSLLATRAPSKRAAALAVAAVLAVGGFVCGRTTTSPSVASATLKADGAEERSIVPAMGLRTPASGAPPAVTVAAAPAPAAAPSTRDQADEVPAAAPRVHPDSATPRSADRPRPSKTVDAAPLASSSSSSRTASCDPPYVIDKSGVRVFKPECL